MSGWSSICWCGVKIQESSSVRLTISCRVIYCGLSKACGYTMWEYSVEIKSKIKNVKILARRLELNQLAGTPESGESRGYFPPSLSKGGEQKRRCFFTTTPQVISWFTNTELKQIRCSCSHAHKIKRVFYNLLSFLQSTSLLNRNKHNWERFFCFL